MKSVHKYCVFIIMARADSDNASIVLAARLPVTHSRLPLVTATGKANPDPCVSRSNTQSAKFDLRTPNCWCLRPHPSKFSVCSRWPSVASAPLRQTHSAQLVKQCSIAHMKCLSRLSPVPAI